MEHNAAPSPGAVIVVGAGPGVSGSLARLWAEAGHPIGLVGIEDEVLSTLAGQLSAHGVEVRTCAVDITDVEAATAALQELAAALGPVDVLHFNPSAFRAEDALTLSVPHLLADVALGVGGLLTALQAVHPALREGSRITATGSIAADKPWSGAPSLGVQKGGLRSLVHAIDGLLADQGIRAVSLTVQGALATEGPFTPDRVAAALLDAARQDPEQWQSEVAYRG